jgi:hypothetical protein
VLRHVDRLLLPDVAAALRMPEPVVVEIDALVRQALVPLGGVPALRAALATGPPPPVALAGRVLAPLIDAVSPSYLAAPAATLPGPRPDPELGAGTPEARPRRIPGVVVALAIVGGLAVVTAGRQLVESDPPPLPPPVPPPCTTVAVGASGPVIATLPPLSLQPPAACPAP